MNDHATEVFRREDDAYGWRCTCGQSSDHPWTKATAEQQVARHVAEWEAFTAPHCVKCGGVITAGSTVTMLIGTGEFRTFAHSDCVTKKGGDSGESNGAEGSHPDGGSA